MRRHYVSPYSHSFRFESPAENSIFYDPAYGYHGPGYYGSMINPQESIATSPLEGYNPVVPGPGTTSYRPPRQ